MSKSEQVTMHKVRETKGAVRYEEPFWKNDPDYLIGTLYLRKQGLDVHYGTEGTYPAKIDVTVEAN